MKSMIDISRRLTIITLVVIIVVVVVHLASGGAELHSITQRRNVNAEERFGAT